MTIKLKLNTHPPRKNGKDGFLSRFTERAVEQIRRFHRSMPGYEPTPLLSLPGLTGRLGLKSLLVKDESVRFDLQAFKILGASWAMARVICREAGTAITDITWSAVKDQPGNLIFCAATDGNHGMAVAWMSRELGCRAKIFLPGGSSSYIYERIASTGAEVELFPGNYDDTVRYAADMSAKEGWHLIQDTSWPGYGEIPRWIMQGYATLIDEALHQSADLPTHIIVPCGVGSFAGAVQAVLVCRYGGAAPKLITVEPSAADCCYQSACSGRREPVAVPGELKTIMTGLACGEPSRMGWEVLNRYAAGFAACEESIARRGVRLLASPEGDDPVIISGPSGAVTAGFLETFCLDNAYHSYRDALALTESSRVLCISTEGRTDPQLYDSLLTDGIRS